MARIHPHAVIVKRWFFWPAVAAIVVLDRIGVIRDRSKATEWLVDRALRIEVR